MIGIWYFSGTGKCRKLAEEIVNGISDSETEIKDITSYVARNNFNKFITYDKLVIIFPIYGGDIPHTLIDFFSELNGNQVFTILIALWGNVYSGKALNNAKDALKKRGFQIVAGAEILAEHSFSFENIRLAEGRPTKEETEEVISFVKRNFECTDNSIKFTFAKKPLDIGLLMLLPQSFIPRIVIKMILDNEKCLNCKICKSRCPVNAVRDDMSINNRKCIRCLSCESYCPVNARSHTFANEFSKRFFAKHQHNKQQNKFFEHPK